MEALEVVGPGRYRQNWPGMGFPGRPWRHWRPWKGSFPAVSCCSWRSAACFWKEMRVGECVAGWMCYCVRMIYEENKARHTPCLHLEEKGGTAMCFSRCLTCTNTVFGENPPNFLLFVDQIVSCCCDHCVVICRCTFFFSAVISVLVCCCSANQARTLSAKLFCLSR